MIAIVNLHFPAIRRVSSLKIPGVGMPLVVRHQCLGKPKHKIQTNTVPETTGKKKQGNFKRERGSFSFGTFDFFFFVQRCEVRSVQSPTTVGSGQELKTRRLVKIREVSTAAAAVSSFCPNKTSKYFGDR